MTPTFILQMWTQVLEPQRLLLGLSPASGLCWPPDSPASTYFLRPQTRSLPWLLYPSAPPLSRGLPVSGSSSQVSPGVPNIPPYRWAPILPAPLPGTAGRTSSQESGSSFYAVCPLWTSWVFYSLRNGALITSKIRFLSDFVSLQLPRTPGSQAQGAPRELQQGSQGSPLSSPRS